MLDKLGALEHLAYQLSVLGRVDGPQSAQKMADFGRNFSGAERLNSANLDGLAQNRLDFHLKTFSRARYRVEGVVRLASEYVNFLELDEF